MIDTRRCYTCSAPFLPSEEQQVRCDDCLQSLEIEELRNALEEALAQIMYLREDMTIEHRDFTAPSTDTCIRRGEKALGQTPEGTTDENDEEQ